MHRTAAVGIGVLLALSGCTSADDDAPPALPAACELSKAPHATAEQRASLAERLEAGTGEPPDLTGPHAARRFEAFGKVTFAVFGLRSALGRERFGSSSPGEQTVDQAQEELARACQALRTA
ncbi:MAG: hypothetical protein Q8R60_11590 [Mycobacteriales bacterium]|nr:hypothetical protein [Mycobacteriales bacterium]